MHKPAGGANIWFWKRRAEARYCLTVARLLFAQIRYRLLCFKHFGWVPPCYSGSEGA
jgi:hypothetical protein